jgi:hypothetical protein
MDDPSELEAVVEPEPEPEPCTGTLNMSDFMELELLPKGATYFCDCAKCGTSLWTHEWINEDHNERRDAMAAGTLRCDECTGHADPATFLNGGKQYAARMSAPGYLDCTDWEFDTNKRRLMSAVRGGF